MYSSLKDEKLKLLEKDNVELEFGNSSLLEEFNNSFKQKAQHYLRTRLKNDLIEFRLRISENAKTNTNILYTPQDKYKYLSEKNPLLDKLRQDFNLDYE